MCIMAWACWHDPLLILVTWLAHVNLHNNLYSSLYCIWGFHFKLALKTHGEAQMRSSHYASKLHHLLSQLSCYMDSAKEPYNSMVSNFAVLSTNASGLLISSTMTAQPYQPQ